MPELKSRVLYEETTGTFSYGTIEAQATNDNGKAMYGIRWEGSKGTGRVQWIAASNVFVLENQSFELRTAEK